MKTFKWFPKHSEVLIKSRNTLKLRLIVILVSGLSSHHVRICTVGLDRKFSIRIDCWMHDRRDLEGVLEDTADVRSRSMPVLHITTYAESEQRRFCKVQVNIASDIVLGQLELRVKCRRRVSGNDTRLVVHTENKTVTEKFRTSAYIGAYMRIGRKVIGHKIKPVGRRIQVRIHTIASVVNLCLRELLRHS